MNKALAEMNGLNPKLRHNVRPPSAVSLCVPAGRRAPKTQRNRWDSLRSATPPTIPKVTYPCNIACPATAPGAQHGKTVFLLDGTFCRHVIPKTRRNRKAARSPSTVRGAYAAGHLMLPGRRLLPARVVVESATLADSRHRGRERTDGRWRKASSLVRGKRTRDRSYRTRGTCRICRRTATPIDPSSSPPSCIYYTTLFPNLSDNLSTPRLSF